MSSLVPRAACPGTGCDKEIQEDKGQVSELGEQRTVGNPLGAVPSLRPKVRAFIFTTGVLHSLLL